jgi:hypothetical protein
MGDALGLQYETLPYFLKILIISLRSTFLKNLLSLYKSKFYSLPPVLFIGADRRPQHKTGSVFSSASPSGEQSRADAENWRAYCPIDIP